jgi:hypothetical protein
MSSTPQPLPQPPSISSNSTSSGAIIGAVLGSFAALGLVVFAIALYRRQKARFTQSSSNQRQQKQNKKINLFYMFGGNKSVQEWNSDNVVQMSSEIISVPSSSVNTPATAQNTGEHQQISPLSLVNQSNIV